MSAAEIPMKTYFPRSVLENLQKYGLTAEGGPAVVGIKISGKCLDDFTTCCNIVRQVLELRLMGTNVVIVHGGGKQITAECKKEGIEKRELHGLRVTSQREMDIMKRCVPELTNMLIKAFETVAKDLQLKSIPVIGLNGYDGGIVKGELHSAEFEGSRTGKVVSVNGAALTALMNSHVVVLNSLGDNWNFNADDVFAAVCGATNASLGVVCSDTALYNKRGQTIRHLFTDQVAKLYQNGTFNSVIKPKVDAAVQMADTVCPVVIVKGMDHSAIERELYTKKGGGTRIDRRLEAA